jgi:hypothetical protein
MADTGWVNGGTFQNVDRSGGPAWNTPANAETQDDSYTYTFSTSIISTDWLRITNFGFSIPEGATIDGIEVRADKFATVASSIRDSYIYLRTSAGQSGDNKADTETYWQNSDTDNYISWGGATDDWNAGFDYADINDESFGIDISAYHAQLFRNARIDHVQIKIYYTEGGAPPAEGWDKKMNNVKNIKSINGIPVENIKSVNGV